MKFKIFLILGIIFLNFNLVLGEKLSPRAILDHLYQMPGQLPINDMLVELEINSLESSGAGAPEEMTPFSKDKLFFKKPNKIRVDSIMLEKDSAVKGMLITIIRDGFNRYMYISQGEYPVKVQDDTPTPTFYLPYFMQNYPSYNQYKYLHLGTEQVEGVKTDVIGIIDPDADTEVNMTKVWVDAKKWVPVKLEKKKKVKKGSGKITMEEGGESFEVKRNYQIIKTRVIYSDFKKLKDGRWLPFMIKIYEDDDLIRMLIYRQVSVNIGLEDNLFEPMKKVMESK